MPNHQINHPTTIRALVLNGTGFYIDGKAVVYPHRRTTEISIVDSWTADDERHYLAGEDVAQ
ncbi:MAG: hypothetical protein JXM69_02685 [Anaerolineae bacterium]|nr:hypothetical protein [Anaerolineae bacterium]